MQKEYINKIFHGDCIDVMKSIPNNSIDLIVTSPPYNLGIDYDGYIDELDWKKYYVWCKEWLTEIFRILKKDGRFCLNHYLSIGRLGNRLTPLMTLNEMCCEEIGFKHHALSVINDTTISKRTSWGSWLSPSAPYINCPFEGVLILYKEDWKKHVFGKSTINKEDFMMGCLGSWKLPPPKRTEHPATFPITLPLLCINLLTYEDDIVLDPFIGSGTTAIACLQTNRRFIGIELSEKYYQQTIKKIEQTKKDIDKAIIKPWE